jgi:hypothetical protein
MRQICKLVSHQQLLLISDTIKCRNLVVTTDGSYNPITTKASCSWVFNSGPKTIYSASSKITAANRNAYRAELLGLLAALTIIQQVEERHPETTGKFTLISDCKKALRNAFRPGPVGVKDATQDEFDIILSIRSLRETLRTTTKPEWTPGHPSAADPRGEQVWNAAAHALAVERLHNEEQLGFDDDYLSPPVISVLHNGEAVTRGLLQLVAAECHYEDLKLKLIKDNKWSEKVFQDVDWTSYHKAMLDLPRPQRLSISKLSHGLWNTNEQNNKYYHQAGSCPLCTALETQAHVFSCPHQAAKETRTEALATLRQTLQKAQIPPPLLSLLIKILSSPTGHIPPNFEYHSPYNAQLQVGWHNLHCGHLSKK